MKKPVIGSAVLIGLLFLSTLLIYGQESDKKLQNIPDIGYEISDVIVIDTNECHVGTASGLCAVIGGYICHDHDPVSLYIDGIFQSSKNESAKTIIINNNIYSGWLFEPWNTSLYENGLHELTIIGQNNEVITSIIVLVDN